MTDYIVLRDLAQVPTASPFDRPMAARAGVAARLPPEPRVEVLRGGTRRQMAEVAGDPEVAAVAPVMRTRLVRPAPTLPAAPGHGGGGNGFPADVVMPGADAWSVAAVGGDTSSRGGRGVVAAVLDTGIDATHPTFAGVTLDQRDFSGAGNGDVNGHGTHCAATILGRDVVGRRIGIARGITRALIGKVLADDGGGTSEGAFAGIQWAVEHGAHIVSMSLAFDFPGMVDDLVGDGWPAPAATSAALESYRANQRMFDALMEMIRARAGFGPGTLVVAAAGNESGRDAHPPYEVATQMPAAAEGVISVGALGRVGGGRFAVAAFSNTFPQVTAPGMDILSARAGGGLATLSGTGTACPCVAGVAALWWEALAASGLTAPTAVAVAARLMATARADVFAPGTDPADRGRGLVTAPA